MAKKSEGCAVIGDGAPSDAQSCGLGVQGWIQATRLNNLEERLRLMKHTCAEKVAAGARGGGLKTRDGPVYFSSFACRQYFSSGLISLISMPGLTKNLQLSRSCGRSSSVSFPTTRQYWQSWFQQKRP